MTIVKDKNISREGTFKVSLNLFYPKVSSGAPRDDHPMAGAQAVAIAHLLHVQLLPCVPVDPAQLVIPPSGQPHPPDEDAVVEHRSLLSSGR